MNDFSSWKQSRWLWLISLLLTGFWLRLTFLVGNIYYTDEFISMLAAKMVAERGWPILPSGLFYDHGLLYSLTAGGFVALLGFSEQVARWPVLLVGVLTIAAYYAAARRLFDSQLTGVIAAVLITFDTMAMKWGVWARMYALAHLFVLLSVSWLLLSTLKRSNQRGRYLFLIFLAGMLFSHSLTFLLLPPLAMLLLIFSLAYRRDWFTRRGLWPQAVMAGAIVAAALSIVASGHVSSTASFQDGNQAALAMPSILGFLQGFFTTTLQWENYASLFDYFQTPAYNWLLSVIGLGLLLTLYRLWQRQLTFAGVAFLFVLLLPLLVIFEMGTLLTDEWQQGRYMFFLTLPFFMLLGAESLSRLLRAVIAAASLLSARAGWLNPAPNRIGSPKSTLDFYFQVKPKQLEMFAPFIVAIPIAILWGRPTWELASVRATGDFDTAYEFVRQNWQPGDRIMTEHPAAAYLYLEQMDYYANQTSAKVLDDDESGELAPLDRYTGSPLIETVESLNATLATGERIWLVVGDKHLNRYYDNFFRQQIYAQMDLAYQAGSKYVFLSRAYPIPLKAEPLTPLAVNFDQRLRLEGYTLDLAALAPDGTASLGLYWRVAGDPPPHPLKVFVQLRNGQNQTIAQADHFIYDGLFNLNHWYALQVGDDWLRDSADLRLPLPLVPAEGPYRLYIGFYDPDTFERLPVIGDTSGENAAVIDLSVLPASALLSAGGG